MHHGAKGRAATLRAGILLTLLAAACFFAGAPRAEAHARMVKSSPAKDAKLDAAPGRIDLWFNELLEDGFNTLEVYPASELGAAKHGNFADGKVTVDEKDRTHLSVKLKTLAPGEYVADWRVLSRDGHSAPGRITFTVKGPD
jgi:methionine-rich copper-binding protein CopC